MRKTADDKPTSSKKNALNNLPAKEWIKFTKSWFICNPLPRDKKEILHPAKFPEEMIEEFIKFFTKKRETVLDPLAGTGSTLIAAANNYRSCLGIELIEKYYSIAKKRIDKKISMIKGVNKLKQLSGKETSDIKLKIIKGDAMELARLMKEININKVDYCITSPPYWKMLKTTRGGVESVSKKRIKNGLDHYYSDNEKDLGNIEDYNCFLDVLYNIFSEVYKLLKDGGYLTVIIQNIRTPNGEMKPLAWDLAKKLSNLYTLKQEKIWCQDNKPLGIWGYPKEYVSSVHHHYCLIFQKPIK